MVRIRCSAFVWNSCCRGSNILTMSHFVTLRTDLREREHLLGALRDLGYSVREGDSIPLRGDSRQEESAEIVIDTACDHEIGFRQRSRHYEVVADWYNIERLTDLRRQKFLERLTQLYAYNIIRDQAREQNLIVEEEQEANGDIILVLSERG